MVKKFLKMFGRSHGADGRKEDKKGNHYQEMQNKRLEEQCRDGEENECL
jgi:hypothetical protein